MPRRSEHSAQKLLKAARAMIGRGGFSGLRLRAVARKAGVNLGLFHYHFGTRKIFVRRLLQDIYEDFFGRLRLESGSGGRPVERLRRALLVFGAFARDNRDIFVALLAEALHGDAEAVSYLQANVPRHVQVITDIVAQGQKAREIKPLPLPVAASFALSAMGAPNLMFTAMERGGGASMRRKLKFYREEFLSDSAIRRRADLVIAALGR